MGAARGAACGAAAEAACDAECVFRDCVTVFGCPTSGPVRYDSFVMSIDNIHSNLQNFQWELCNLWMTWTTSNVAPRASMSSKGWRWQSFSTRNAKYGAGDESFALQFFGLEKKGKCAVHFVYPTLLIAGAMRRNASPPHAAPEAVSLFARIIPSTLRSICSPTGACTSARVGGGGTYGRARLRMRAAVVRSARRFESLRRPAWRAAINPLLEFQSRRQLAPRLRPDPVEAPRKAETPVSKALRLSSLQPALLPLALRSSKHSQFFSSSHSAPQALPIPPAPPPRNLPSPFPLLR